MTKSIINTLTAKSSFTDKLYLLFIQPKYTLGKCSGIVVVETT